MLIVCGLAVRAFAGGLLGPDRRLASSIAPVTIDINRAGLPELQALPGVGRVRAEAIILHRVRHGRFRAVDDLSAVEGLGSATVEALRTFVRVQ